MPEGFVYKPELISHEEEQALVSGIEQLEFADVKMRDVVAKRRAAHFGRSYAYETAALASAPSIPEFLAPLQQRIAEFAARDPEEFPEVLVTDYPSGSLRMGGIMMHRDSISLSAYRCSANARCSFVSGRWRNWQRNA